MGEAKRRGSYKERVAQAIQREAAHQDALYAQKWERLRVETERQDAAYAVMTDEQFDLTDRREEAIRRRRVKTSADLATLVGFLSPYGRYR
jgi:hypothetical protein